MKKALKDKMIDVAIKGMIAAGLTFLALALVVSEVHHWRDHEKG